MKICIMYFASSLLRIFGVKIIFQEFFYGVPLVLSRCCFHHLVENSILYKKVIQHFYIGTILFQKVKSYGRWSAEKKTVKFYMMPGVRNRQFYFVPVVRNGNIYLVPNDSYEQKLFGSQMVKHVYVQRADIKRSVPAESPSNRVPSAVPCSDNPGRQIPSFEAMVFLPPASG